MQPPGPSLFPYTTLFRSLLDLAEEGARRAKTHDDVIAGLLFKSRRDFFRRFGKVGSHGDGYVADRKSTRLNSSHVSNSYAVLCLKKKIPTSTASHSKRSP